MSNKIFTSANLLSFLRLPLALLLIISPSLVVKYVCLILAILTDIFDGFIARKLNQSSKLGAFIDPFFDKIFVFAVFFFFYFELELQFYFVIFYFLRDIITSISFIFIRFFHLCKLVELKARYVGKIVTLLQFFALFFLILGQLVLFKIFVYSILLFSVIAIIDYFFYVLRGSKC